MDFGTSYGGLADFNIGLTNTSSAPVFLTDSAQASYNGGTGAGILQSSMLDGSYFSQASSLLSGLLTWDTTRRLTQNQQQSVQMSSRQNPNNTDYTTRAIGAAGGVRLGDLLPFAVIGFVAWRLLK